MGIHHSTDTNKLGPLEYELFMTLLKALHRRGVVSVVWFLVGPDQSPFALFNDNFSVDEADVIADAIITQLEGMAPDHPS